MDNGSFGAATARGKAHAAQRPKEYSQEIADRLCERILSGSKGLKAICDSDPRLPWANTARRWADANPEFAIRLAHARKMQGHILIDECVEIADTPEIGEEITIMPDGKRKVVHGDMIAHRKLRVQTRLDIAARLDPANYGAKTDVNVSGTLTLEALVLSSLGEAPAPQPAMRNITPPSADSLDDLL